MKRAPGLLQSAHSLHAGRHRVCLLRSPPGSHTGTPRSRAGCRMVSSGGRAGGHLGGQWQPGQPWTRRPGLWGYTEKPPSCGTPKFPGRGHTAWKQLLQPASHVSPETGMQGGRLPHPPTTHPPGRRGFAQRQPGTGSSGRPQALGVRFGRHFAADSTAGQARGRGRGTQSLPPPASQCQGVCCGLQGGGQGGSRPSRRKLSRHCWPQPAPPLACPTGSSSRQGPGQGGQDPASRWARNRIRKCQCWLHRAASPPVGPLGCHPCAGGWGWQDPLP